MRADSVSLSAAVGELGIPRSRLMRFIREGLPVERERGNGRIRIQIEAAKNWIELFGDDHKPKAKQLDRSDPRFRERAASAALAIQKALVATGALVERESTVARYEGELTEFRSRLFQISQRLSPTATRAENMADLELGIAEALEPLRADDLATWPPVNESAVESLLASRQDDESPDDEERATLPVMAASDPRGMFVVAQGSRRELALADFNAAHFPVYTAVRLAGQTYSAIRERVAEVTTRVELSESDDLLGTVNRELDAVFESLSQRELV